MGITAGTRRSRRAARAPGTDDPRAAAGTASTAGTGVALGARATSSTAATAGAAGTEAAAATIATDTTAATGLSGSPDGPILPQDRVGQVEGAARDEDRSALGHSSVAAGSARTAVTAGETATFRPTGPAGSARG